MHLMEQASKYNFRLIFVYLIFYGLAVGVWAEFSQLWLDSQNYKYN